MTITFVGNAEIATPSPNTRTVVHGASLGTQLHPLPEGWGWFINPSLTQQLLSDTPITVSMTVTPQRIGGGGSGRFTVTFEPNGDRVSLSVNSMTVLQGTPITNMPIPTRTNYIFLGWFTQQTGGVRRDNGFVPTANIRLFARWMNYDTMSREELAQELLDRHRGVSASGRTLTLREVFAQTDIINRLSPYANIEDTANGLRAETRRFFEQNPDNPNPPTGTPAPAVFLSIDLLIAMLRMNDRFGSYTVNTISGANHFGGQRDEHIRGMAVDFQSHNYVMEGIGQRPNPVLDYLEGTWRFRTQRNRHEHEEYFAHRNYLGWHNHFHLSIFGRN